MASQQVSEKIGSRLFVKSYDHDPGATTAIIVSPDGGTTKRTADMRDYEVFGVLAKPTVVGGGGLTLLEIVASAASDMSSPEVVKATATVAADALDDNVFLEVSAEEVAQQGTDSGKALRYVAGRLTMATGTDEASVTYIAIPKRPASGLTATAIA